MVTNHEILPSADDTDDVLLPAKVGIDANPFLEGELLCCTCNGTDLENYDAKSPWNVPTNPASLQSTEMEEKTGNADTLSMAKPSRPAPTYHLAVPGLNKWRGEFTTVPLSEVEHTRQAREARERTEEGPEGDPSYDLTRTTIPPRPTRLSPPFAEGPSTRLRAQGSPKEKILWWKSKLELDPEEKEVQGAYLHSRPGREGPDELTVRVDPSIHYSKKWLIKRNVQSLLLCTSGSLPTFHK